MLAIRRRDDISTLNWLTSFRTFIFAGGGAFQHELARSFGLTIRCVTSLARVRLLLGEDSVNTWMHGFLEVRRSSTFDWQENLLSAVLAVSLTSKPEHPSSTGLTCQGITFICIVIHLVFIIERSGCMSRMLQVERRSALDTQAIRMCCEATAGKACEHILRISLQATLCD